MGYPCGYDSAPGPGYMPNGWNDSDIQTAQFSGPPRPVSRNPWAEITMQQQLVAPLSTPALGGHAPVAQHLSGSPTVPGSAFVPSGQSDASEHASWLPQAALGTPPGMCTCPPDKIAQLPPRLPHVNKAAADSVAADGSSVCAFFTARSRAGNSSRASAGVYSQDTQYASLQGALGLPTSFAGSLQSHAHSPRTPSRGSADAVFHSLLDNPRQRASASGCTGIAEAAAQAVLPSMPVSESPAASIGSAGAISDLTAASSLHVAVEMSPTQVCLDASIYPAGACLEVKVDILYASRA
jgi:hypothetical protein